MNIHRLIHLTLGLALLTPTLADDTPAAPSSISRRDKPDNSNTIS
ncbi:hypothetical protein Rhal01_02252 [Rubritalea halochordaticola]|uniref:Uncharacterized protein n=1 Tax=Rubritalea halochordaticola TaxID=714537 RepID=A0ABP9V4Q4_9BACT